MHEKARSLPEKISIIIPAYNCKATLQETLGSVLNQNYADMEIIIVDDGSTDGTADVIRKYESSDNRIRAVCQENKGPSAARNAGIEMAAGDLLIFLDADDRMETDAVPRLVRQSQEKKCDLLIAGMKKVYKDAEGRLRKKEFLPPAWNCKSSEEIWNGIIGMLRLGMLNSLWAKVYRRDIIERHSIRLDTRLDMGEDLQFNLNYLEHCDSLLTMPYVSYIYQTQNSYLTNKYRENLFRERRVSIELLRTHLEQHGLSVNVTYFLFMKLMIAQNMQDLEHGIKGRDRRKKLQELYRDESILNAIAHYRPEGLAGGAVFLIVRTRSPWLTDLFSRVCVVMRKMFSTRIPRVSV